MLANLHVIEETHEPFFNIDMPRSARCFGQKAVSAGHVPERARTIQGKLVVRCFACHRRLVLEGVTGTWITPFIIEEEPWG